MIHLFLISFYVLICLGFVIGILNDSDESSNIIKFLMALFSPIVAPVLLGVALGLIIVAQVEKQTNRE